MRGRIATYLTAISVAAHLISSCSPPYSPSNQDIFLRHTDICMVAGQKEYIGATGVETQSSFNREKGLYRGGNVLKSSDSTGVYTVETIEEYFVFRTSSTPGEAGTSIDGYLYLKHRSLPNSFRTYGSEKAPVTFDILKKEDGLVWLWATSLKIGAVIRTE